MSRNTKKIKCSYSTKCFYDTLQGTVGNMLVFCFYSTTGIFEIEVQETTHFRRTISADLLPNIRICVLNDYHFSFNNPENIRLSSLV